MHDEAFAEVQVKTAVPPFATTVGAAAKVTVGAAMMPTAATAGALLPPGPVQTSE